LLTLRTAGAWRLFGGCWMALAPAGWLFGGGLGAPGSCWEALWRGHGGRGLPRARSGCSRRRDEDDTRRERAQRPAPAPSPRQCASQQEPGAPSPRQCATQQEPRPSSTRQRASKPPQSLVLTSVKKKLNRANGQPESVVMSSEFLTFAAVLISSYCLWVKKCALYGSRSNSREPPLVRWRAVPLRLQSRSKKSRRSQ